MYSAIPLYGNRRLVVTGRVLFHRPSDNDLRSNYFLFKPLQQRSRTSCHKQG